MRLMQAFILAICTLPAATPAQADTPSLTEKMNAYIECINRLSERAYESRSRYFSWVGKTGPTGKEPIIYGTYTIYETADCKQAIEKANALEPHDADLEAAASAYVTAVVALEPLLIEANDYYEQEDYKDDKMAKGKALHPRLVAAWDAFASADKTLSTAIDVIDDKRAEEALAEIERTEGRNGRYHIRSLMIRAKHVISAENSSTPDLDKLTAAVSEYDAVTKAAEQYAAANPDSKIGSSFIDSAKQFLVTAKQLMRRVRDKTPYSEGEQMMLETDGGGWMVEGSPARLTRDYNELVDSYNRGASF